MDFLAFIYKTILKKIKNVLDGQSGAVFARIIL